MTETSPAICQSYPREVKIGDNRTITLRLMGKSDRDSMVDFARTLPADDLLFLRRDITDPEVIDGWIHNVEIGRSVTVLAERDGELVGYGSLNLNAPFWTQHVGEIRVLVSPDYRKLGLGRRLAYAIFAIAKDLGLQKMLARMTPDQKGARATFERLGFRAEALLHDFVLDRDGKTRDLLIMSYDIAGLTDSEHLT
jgi:L-amino acid N-acyltransferase YncA